MLECFESKIEKKENAKTKNILPEEEFSSNFHFIFKAYDFRNCFSYFLHQSNINETFEIEGPLVNLIIY